MKRMQEDKDFKQIQEDVSMLNGKHLYRHRVQIDFDESILLEVSFISDNDIHQTFGDIKVLMSSGVASFMYEDGANARNSLYLTYNTIVFLGSATEEYNDNKAHIVAYNIDTLI